MNKVVVFGGNGFIGKHLVRQLASAQPEDEIVVFDRFDQRRTGALSSFHDLKNVRSVHGDFFNAEEVADVLTGASYVFHLVSSTTPAVSNNNPYIDIETNLKSSVELFDLCAKNSVKKVIYFSSGGTVYGDTDSNSIHETALPMPLSPYGIIKLTIENYLRYFKRTHGLDYIIYRIANPYGPGQNPFGKQGVVPIFMQKVLNKEPISIFGDGTMSRDYIYVEDLAKMIVGSYAKSNKYSEYNIGSGHGTTVNELVESIEKSSQGVIEKEYLATPSTYIQNSILDTSRFTEEFKLYPETNLTEGIKRTWDYVKNIS